MLIHGSQADGIELSFEAKMAGALFEFAHFELGVRPHGVRLDQRVMWSWLSAPIGRRDKPGAVVGPVELNE